MSIAHSHSSFGKTPGTLDIEKEERSARRKSQPLKMGDSIEKSNGRNPADEEQLYINGPA